jgi:hypothetical protein
MVRIMMMVMIVMMMMMMIIIIIITAIIIIIIMCRSARLLSRKVEFMNYAWDSFLFSRKEIVNVPDNLGRHV